MTELDETYTFLQQIRRKETEIRRKQLQYDELKSCLLPEAIRYDVDRVQSSAEDPMGRIFSELDDLERQIAELKAEKAGLISLVAGAIEQLEDDFEKTVLAEFYIGRRSMRDVARAIGYSPRGVLLPKAGSSPSQHTAGRKVGEHCKLKCAKIEE